MTRSRDTANIIPTVDAKGDLLVGTANNEIDNLTAGTNGTYLKANSASATGLEWATGVESIVDAKGDLLVGTADNTIDNLSPGTNGQVLTANSATGTGLEWTTQEGYRFVQTLYFTSSGTFTKATYPWLRAIKIKVQAGGGGSGGVATTPAGTWNASAGGGGGGYAERFFTNIASLDASVTVIVGNGGAGAAAGNNSGSAGGISDFGGSENAWRTRATGGSFGEGMSARNTFTTSLPGIGGDGLDGDLLISGSSGVPGLALNTSAFGNYPGFGGGSVLGAGRRSNRVGATGGSAAIAGLNYGGGASGSANLENTTQQAGAAGAPGIVIVELYA
jgi:hypothetical protein